MTDAAPAKLSRSPVLNLAFIGALALFGAVVAFVAFYLILGSHESIGVIQVGQYSRVEGASGQVSAANTDVIEDPAALTERVRSIGFARTIAEALHDDHLATMLPAAQYGGDGALRARPLREGEQVEVRLKAASDQEALTILGAIFAEVLADHQKLIGTYREAIVQQEDLIRAQLKTAQSFEQFLEDKIRGTQITAESAAEYSILIATRDQSSRQVLTLNQLLGELIRSAGPPDTRESRVIAQPAIGKSFLSNPWRAAAVGLIAGAAVGLALLQIRQIIFA